MTAKKSLELNAEIVVIGGGSAGLAAAVSAFEKGARHVIVLEAAPAAGGNGLFPGGLFSPENTIGPPSNQIQAGMSPNDKLDTFFNRHMSYCHWQINPRLVHLLLSRSADTIKWLRGMGCSLEGPGAAVKTLHKKCIEFGVDIFPNTRAKHLITDSTGRVTGATAEGKDGGIKITAAGVIIATGGMAGNRELLERYLPGLHQGDYLFIGGMPHQGDGLNMALEIGADTDGFVVPEMTGPMCPWLNLGQEVTVNPKTIWVNRKGVRFTQELGRRFEAAHAVFQQPGKVAFVIMDEKTVNTMLRSNIMPGRPQVSDAECIAFAERVRGEFRSQSEKGNVKITDSMDEIARFIGVNPDVIQATIDEYNAYCDKKHDDLFAKDPVHLVALRNPPYYAIRCCIRLLVTHGGIKINHKMEVVDKDDNPIPGLYAAGVDTGGTDWSTYDDGLPAHSIGFSINQGRIAGENAVSHTRVK